MGQENLIDRDSLVVAERPNVEVADSLFKIKKADFIEQYSIDDTTAALITMFYRKRSTAKVQLSAIPLAIITGFVVGGLHEAAPGSNPTAVRTNAFVLGGLIGVGISVEAIMKLKNYSRKELYLALKRYEEGQGVLDEHYFQFKESDFNTDTALKTPGYKHVE
jgi:hypothetical protein